jgi:hypothetical protein
MGTHIRTMETRKINGFAVIDGPSGSLIYGTVRPTEADAWSAFISHNPQVEGFDCPARVVACEMFITETISEGAKCDTNEATTTE